MDARERLRHSLDALSEPELSLVSHVLAALRSRHLPPSAFDPDVFGPLYLESGAEDRALAESGISDFAKGLVHEDEK